MSNDPPGDDAKRNTWRRRIALILLALLIPASLLMALFGAATSNDSYSHEIDKWWGLIGTVEGLVLFLGSGCGVAYLVSRNRHLHTPALALLTLAALGSGYLLILGMQMTSEASRRGGDYGGVAVLASVIFGVLFPGALGLASAGAGACIFKLNSNLESDRGPELSEIKKMDSSAGD